MSSAPHRLSVFPAFHKVSGRPVLVVGGGAEALAKVRLLTETEARIVVVAEDPGEELAAVVTRAGGEIRRRAFQPSDLEGAALAFAAAEDDEAADIAVVEAARAAGVPVNAVDRPEWCDFYVPAIVNRAPVAVAISSAGTGPVLARHIRARVEAMLPVEIGALARLAESFRATVARVLPPGEARLRFWGRFFSGSVADRVFSGRLEEARGEAARLLNGVRGEEAGFVWLVGAGPGAADLLTLRAQRLLQEADVIVYDRLVPEAVVAMGRRDAERISVGKAKGAHSMSQSAINALLVDLGRAGRRVVRLKAGDPLVFGRAGEEMTALTEAGIAHEVVPGITAAVAAAASIRLPLTLRGVASSLVFATGHDRDGETLPGWAGLALSGATVAVYMGRSVAGRVATHLIAAGLAADTPVAAVANASRTDEAVFAGTLDDMARLAGLDDAAGEASVPVLIIVGRAVAHADLSNAQPLTQARAVAAA
ncbi:uroporphyrin-III C-methyltransferase / precorrin-2 dehydrogenase / sirohydrochlorin ferrochelatase [Pseudoxanthobacter soli DSM 19599]|uniref:Uroporphyrin-III C-methyltransferase / precorrin-2 dehydrogenase / sirohydrochlorin ferrochelatase n=1 Tax=Pseudoxanthobacter soli DSM 19599 TaxID=1123029 RepID=A0A1M7Z758_9HYPH|nr:siroheme synthase CysG [Pseudoxanthobacter soli]SHO60731.1 uroporphyrin-III C-methyltransferase / precorrin-2 dehydrogenase / sirohydrochlorin ferrochelatase [Pseudoxanthobacter soli DSM 19599]